MLLIPPHPIFRGSVALQSNGSAGIPAAIGLTTWGSPLSEADHVAFFFGGMPASAEEPALHSLVAGEDDVYKSRRIHLICMDKPGMGQTPLAVRFSIRRDWPEIVHQVAANYRLERYGVLGVSNGGPHVMACLTHPKTRNQIAAASMIVGVSDVSASGYFSPTHPSGFLEGLYNSLPIAVTGPINYLLFSFGNLLLFQVGLFERFFSDLPQLHNPPGKNLLRRLINDSIHGAGLGSALDCQQGLSPLYAGQKEQIRADYAAIAAPVSLWYGTKDSTVPMSSAEWLNGILPRSQLFQRATGHGLFFHHTVEVLDDLVAKMKDKYK